MSAAGGGAEANSDVSGGGDDDDDDDEEEEKGDKEGEGELTLAGVNESSFASSAF